MMKQEQAPVSPASDPLIQPVPPDPELAAESAPYCYKSGKCVVIENGASLPTEFCIKTGKKAYKTVEVSLRNPANPRTWFGKQKMVEVGLCRKHLENHVVAVALTWSTLAVGALVFIAGILTLSFISCLVGLVAMGVSGIFRAMSPVTSKDATENFATIEGACPSYLKMLSDASDIYL